MRVLVITNIFPNAAMPLLGPFNLQQLTALRELCDVQIMGTIPWFPGVGLLAPWVKSGRMVSVPGVEDINGFAVRHPRTLYVPRCPGLSAPLFAGSLAPAVWARRGQVDVILSPWAYPDGCASVLLGRLLGAPVVVKVHGSDINVFSHMPQIRPYLRALLPRAQRVVAVSRPLGERLVELGVAPERVKVVYDGVDRRRFCVRDRRAARDELGLPRDGKIVLYTGSLLQSKGVSDLLQAFAAVSERRPGTCLVLIGDGPEMAACAQAARNMGTVVHIAGARPHDEIGTWMAACDVFTLPSWGEGTPCVILEALACGRRVVATRVGGIPDLIGSDVAGELVPARTPAALADALVRAIDREYDPHEVAATRRHRDWAGSAAELYQVLLAAVTEGGAGHGEIT